MRNKKDKEFPIIFLDVGHTFGEPRGINHENIDEILYNKEIIINLARIWETRITFDGMLSLVPNALDILGDIGIYKQANFSLIWTVPERDILVGTYKERYQMAGQAGTELHIQFHLGGYSEKKSVIAYNGDRKDTIDKSKFFATCVANAINFVLDPKGDKKIIEKIEIEPCSVFSKDVQVREKARSLKRAPSPSIYVEPLSLKNKEHYEFLNSPEGMYALIKVYTKGIEDYIDGINNGVI